MVSVEMWWGQTSWWWPAGLTVTFGPDGLEIQGLVEGPDCDISYCGDRKETFGILGQFFLDTNRMPPLLPDEYLWSSSPVVRFSGDVTGLTFSEAWFDAPSAKCQLQARQLVYAAGEHIATSERSMDLVRISNDSWELRRFVMPTVFRLSIASFPLDRNKDLEIDIELKFVMNVEGGDICYSCWIDSDPFLVRIPQWNIVSLEPPV